MSPPEPITTGVITGSGVAAKGGRGGGGGEGQLRTSDFSSYRHYQYPYSDEADHLLCV